MTFTALVAQPPPMPDDPGGRGEDFGKSSPVGLLVLLVFVIAVVFLARSMTKHLKRVPKTFEKPEPQAETAAGTEPEDEAKAAEAENPEKEKNGAKS